MPDKTDEKGGSVITPERQFWERLADAGVLVVPRWIFSPMAEVRTLRLCGAEGKFGHMRLSYTLADESFFVSPLVL